MGRSQFCQDKASVMKMMRLAAALLLVLLRLGVAWSFLRFPRVSEQRYGSGSALQDIGGWRDLVFDFPGTADDRRLGTEEAGPPKEVCILPFPYQEVLLQGETKQLRLYEERFIKLFDDCMSNHCGVVGMGLLADSGIIQTIPLCEIEAYNRLEGFGIFVTIRVVGRAQLVEMTKQEPYIKAVCTELTDDIPPNLDLPNLVASQIENFMLLLSSMEHRLMKAVEKKKGDDGGGNLDSGEMQRRINIAKLEDRFYEEKDENEEEEDSDEVPEMDRRGRFRQAYNVALNTDTQGYMVAQDSSTERSPQDLTAISWAAFSTDLLREDDATYRIQALDSDKLLDRLKLASIMLQEKKAALQQQMEKAGLQFGGDERGLDEELPPSS